MIQLLFRLITDKWRLQRFDSFIFENVPDYIQSFDFIKRVDKCWIATMNDLESWCFEH